MINMLGEHFDLLARGSQTLIHIPKGADAEHTLLHVETNVTGGPSCDFTFFKDLHISGQWMEQRVNEQGVHKQRAQHYHAEAPRAGDRTHPRQVFIRTSPVQMSITYGRMESGLTYLNFKARGLDEVDLPVGGLLGTDDHTLASSKEACEADPEYAYVTREEEVAAASYTMSGASVS